VVKKPIGAQRCAFLKFELDNGDFQRRKVALQEIARLYRAGFAFPPEQRNAFEIAVNGLVLQQKQDLKVVRWCLNVLARLGVRGNSDHYVRLALMQYEDNPEIVAAGVAALTYMYNGRVGDIPGFESYDPEVRTLAALQNTDPKHLDLSGFKIDIDRALPGTLRLALIIVGINRDIEHLFHPKYNNSEFVRKLGQHDDKIVVQYSVWSAIENKRLGVTDIGVDIRAIEKYPPNVQSKILQLVAEKEKNNRDRHRIIADGAMLNSSEARSGLARGLQSQFYDGLEEITLGWYDQETDRGVQLSLAEHFARFSGDCSPYEDRVFSIIEMNPSFEQRLLLGSEGQPLYQRIKAQSARSGMDDLFSDETDIVASRLMTKNIIERKNLKVVVLSASPLDQDRLRLEEEARDLKEKLRMVTSPTVELTVVNEWAVRTDQIQDILLNEKPRVLHFSGHGDRGSLVFEDRSGFAKEVSAEDFAELIELNRSFVECVVLNACYSEDVATLVKPHVKCVIGCDASIGDDAAIAFSRAFYRSLAHGSDYEAAFKLAVNDVKLNGHRPEAGKYKLLK
jgi:hypothetical protein